MESTIPSNIIGIWSRLEILLGLKQSGHTQSLTEASNLIDELYYIGKVKYKTIKNVQMLLINLKLFKWNFLVNFGNKAFNTRPKLKNMCQLLWVNLYMKKIYLNHYKLINNLNFLSRS